MNKIVEEFIEKKKKKIQQSELEKKNEHLIRLGLIDETKSTREYQDIYGRGLKYDVEKKKYYKGENFPIETTDEEYALICKYGIETLQDQEEIVDKHEEKGLKTISYILLFLSIIGSIFLLIAGANINDGSFFFLYLVYGITALLTSIIVYFFLSVIANISCSLKDIKNKLNN